MKSKAKVSFCNVFSIQEVNMVSRKTQATPDVFSMKDIEVTIIHSCLLFILFVNNFKSIGDYKGRKRQRMETIGRKYLAIE